MAERKAFISPYWAICAGCVLAALFAFFVIAPTVAKAMEGAICEPAEIVEAKVRENIGEKIKKVTDRSAIKQVAELLKANGGGADIPPAVEALLVVDNAGLRIAVVKAGVICGYFSVTEPTAQDVRDILEYMPPGRDA